MQSNQFDMGAVVVSQLAVTEEHSPRDRNEATTRLNLIDTLFFDALGWPREEVILEEPIDQTYTDYSFGRPATRLIVEAKREGEYFTLPETSGASVLRLATLLRGNQNLSNAVKQTTAYCGSRGVELGVVTNGHQMVAFLGSRNDGMSPVNGRAVVFRSLREMEDRFIDLWNWLSPDGIAVGNLSKLLKADARPLPPEKLSQRLIRYPGVKARNEMEIELDILGEIFLQDIVKERELEKDFLKECYCSSGALSQYALVSREILRSRYRETIDTRAQKVSPVTNKTGISPELLETVISKGVSRRPIVLLGDVGVGKTTFVRRLVTIDAKEELDKSIVLYIDFGSQPALRRDIEEFVREKFANQLLSEYDIDIYSNEFVRATYNGELNRFSKGIYGKLKHTAPDRYVDEELKLLDRLMESCESHLKKSLEHLRATQKRNAVAFFDNLDQRDAEFQDSVYLIAQSLSETWNMTTFVSLRPDTFNTSRRSGSLAAYQPRVFTISPPRIDQVVKRRLKFAQKVIDAGRFSLSAEGITLDSSLLRDYIDVLITSLSANASLSECLDNVSRGNVRKALDLLTSFVGSGHVDTKKILEIYRRSGSYTIPLHEFLRAILYGDGEYYNSSSAPVPNVFDISSRGPREHFCLPIILTFLYRQSQQVTSQLGFVDIAKIFHHCQSLGLSADEIDSAIYRGSSSGMIESSIDSDEVSHSPQERFRITQNGAYVIYRLMRSFVYYDAVVVDTPILSDDVRPQLSEARPIEARLDRANDFLDYLDEQYDDFGDIDTGLDWTNISQDVRNDISSIWERLERNSTRRRELS